MKVAIIHDWLTNLGGAERVVLELHNIYPEAPIYTSAYNRKGLCLFDKCEIRTTWLQWVPFLRFHHKLCAPLRPFAFRSLNLEEFDLVISSSSAESKNIKIRKDAIHICYCHTPIRYFWVSPEGYARNPGLGKLDFLAPIGMKIFLNSLKKQDYESAQKVHHFIANSTIVQKRIKDHYDRDSYVIHPPVDTERFNIKSSKERSGYLVVGRQIPYKRIDLAISACNALGANLTVVGNGPEHKKLVRMAGNTIKFVTDANDKQIVEYFLSSKAMIFPGEEDFGIVPVESMAAGLPVIAYAKGGVRDSVVPQISGVFFEEQSTESLIMALRNFETMKFDTELIRKHADKFSNANFKARITQFINSTLNGSLRVAEEP